MTGVQTCALPIYLSTVLDDFSRYIIAWKLCTNMRAEDVTDTLDLALKASGAVQAAGDAIGQHIMPDAACPVSAITAHKAGPDLGADLFVASGSRARRSGQPGMEATARDSECPANPRCRPYRSVLRNEPELQIESLAK